MKVIEILLVEDNPGDILLTRKALKEANIQIHLKVAEDGQQALAMMEAKELPDLILLDLNLPGIDGFEVLKQLKANERTKMIPIVILTSSEDEKDIQAAYGQYCNCYLTKPINLKELMKIVNSIDDFWFSIARLPKKDTD